METLPKSTPEMRAKAEKAFEIAGNATRLMRHNWAIQTMMGQYIPKFLLEPRTAAYSALSPDKKDEEKRRALTWLLPRSHALINQAELRYNLHVGNGNILLFNPRNQPSRFKVPYGMLWTSDEGLRGVYAIELLKVNWQPPLSPFMEASTFEGRQITIGGDQGHTTIESDPDNLNPNLSLCLINGEPYIPRTTRTVPPTSDTPKIKFTFEPASKYPEELDAVLQACKEIEENERFGPNPKTESA